MKIYIDKNYYISSDFFIKDANNIVQCLNDKQIYNQTLSIPYPYINDNALGFINRCLQLNAEYKKPIYFSLRNNDDEIIGCINLFSFKEGDHKAEIGYWLGREYWNKGIMTKAVEIIKNYSLNEFNLVRIGAGVFDFNIGSIKVLEKNGFVYEGTMKSFYHKNGVFYDRKTYAFIK